MNAKQIKSELAAIEITERILAEKKGELQNALSNAIMDEAVGTVDADLGFNGIETPNYDQLKDACVAVFMNSPELRGAASMRRFHRVCQSKITVTISAR